MGKIKSLIALLTAFVAISCVDSGVDTKYDGEVTTLSVTLSKTPSKTSLGDRNEQGEYPIYWSSDDILVMNGEPSSKITIDKANKAVASFDFNASITYPYNVTFPYTKGSSYSVEAPTVVFSASQNYVAGSYDLNSTPMCGYAESEGKGVTMTHLAGVLRFPLLSSVDGKVITQISITAERDIALAGEFKVDCQSGVITPCEGKTTNSIVYTLPKGFKLSKTAPTPVYIAVPKGDFGRCAVVITDESGFNMVLKWTANDVKAGIVREFKNITYKSGAALELDYMDSEKDGIYIESNNNIADMGSEQDELEVDYIPGLVYGYLRDAGGRPMAGIPVSDGFQVVTTDENGFYQMSHSWDAYYVFYIIPEDCEVPIDKYGRPCYYQRIDHFRSLYNFTLKKLPGGKEQEFMLFGFADPQTGSDAAVQRFSTQVVPEVKSYSASLGVPCYGITLGDVISMGGKVNEEYMFYDMRDAMHADKMGMPVFQVMGNHDNCFMNEAKPVQTDAYNSNINLKIQRPFEDALGPVNFAFNRGDAHIIGMRDVQWKSGDNCATDNTQTCFTKEQYDWLKAELAHVSRNKMVVLCFHVPIYNNGSVGDGTYRQEVMNLLDEFAEAHIISGHTHYQRNYDHTKVSSSSHKIYEHVQAAVNGASWTSNINGDGVPNGYGVYHAKGATFKDWYYKGYAKGMNTRDYQIRLYRGNAITGAAIPEGDANKNGTKGYYKFGYNENDILANVFNSDDYWKVEVYEDGKYSGAMTSLSKYHWDITYDQLIGTGVLSDPKRVPTGSECGRDFWAVGVLCGYLGNNNGGLYYKHCYQLWKYTLKNKNAKVEVRATDHKGNVYKCSTITEGTDMTYALYNADTGSDTETDEETFN